MFSRLRTTRSLLNVTASAARNRCQKQLLRRGVSNDVESTDRCTGSCDYPSSCTMRYQTASECSWEAAMLAPVESWRVMRKTSWRLSGVKRITNLAKSRSHIFDDRFSGLFPGSVVLTRYCSSSVSSIVSPCSQLAGSSLEARCFSASARGSHRLRGSPSNLRRSGPASRSRRKKAPPKTTFGKRNVIKDIFASKNPYYQLEKATSTTRLLKSQLYTPEISQPRALASQLNRAASLNLYDKELYQRYAARIRFLMSSMDMRSLALSLNAFARTNHFDEPLLEAAATRFRALLTSAVPQSVSLTVNAFSRLKYQPKHIAAALAEELPSKLHLFNAQDLVVTFSAVSRLRNPPPSTSLIVEFVEHLERRTAADLNLGHIVSLSRSFARTTVAPPLLLVEEFLTKFQQPSVPNPLCADETSQAEQRDHDEVEVQVARMVTCCTMATAMSSFYCSLHKRRSLTDYQQATDSKAINLLQQITQVAAKEFLEQHQAYYQRNPRALFEIQLLASFVKLERKLSIEARRKTSEVFPQETHGMSTCMTILMEGLATRLPSLALNLFEQLCSVLKVISSQWTTSGASTINAEQHGTSRICSDVFPRVPSQFLTSLETRALDLLQCPAPLSAAAICNLLDILSSSQQASPPNADTVKAFLNHILAPTAPPLTPTQLITISTSLFRWKIRSKAAQAFLISSASRQLPLFYPDQLLRFLQLCRESGVVAPKFIAAAAALLRVEAAELAERDLRAIMLELEQQLVVVERSLKQRNSQRPPKTEGSTESLPNSQVATIPAITEKSVVLTSDSETLSPTVCNAVVERQPSSSNVCDSSQHSTLSAEKARATTAAAQINMVAEFIHSVISDLRTIRPAARRQTLGDSGSKD